MKPAVLASFAALETPLDEKPLFPVEEPDGRKDWPELARQDALFKLMASVAPRVEGFPIPNAGKRNPRQARKEHIRAGLFDSAWLYEGPLIAFVELKGYDKRGRPGKPSWQQIGFGNRLVRLGIPCACFFSPHRAADWLRKQGFPVREFHET